MHVVRPQDGTEGVNAYYYSHAGSDWLVPPDDVPDEDPGELVKKEVPVLPGGNRVRAYLDIIAADDASWPEIRGNFVAYVVESAGKPLPWVRLVGRCRFRTGLDSGLAAAWRIELEKLYEAARNVRSK